jgi:hypothetical protein
LTTTDMLYLKQLKRKNSQYWEDVIHKPMLLRNLKDKINELVLEKNSMCC